MLSTEEQAVIDTVADWVDREVRPVVRTLMIVGESTNEIRRDVIAAQLVKRGGS